MILCLIGISLQAHPYALCVAHRGIHTGENAAPENSIEALIKTLDLNVTVGDATKTLPADGVDYDVHHTQDGVGVVYHDAKINLLDVESTADHKVQCPYNGQEIYTLSMAQINKCKLDNGEALPTLSMLLSAIESEILPHFSGFRLSLEFKDTPNEQSLALIYAFHEKYPNNIEVLSFHANHLYCVEEYQEDCTVDLVQNVTLNHSGHDVNQWGYQDPNHFETANFCKGGVLGVYAFCMGKSTTKKDLQARLSEEKSTGVWTVNGKNKIKNLMAMAYQPEFRKTELRIITDYPERCLAEREKQLQILSTQHGLK
jgi:glycerophosphoryl diester phosphodiesterase